MTRFFWVRLMWAMLLALPGWALAAGTAAYVRTDTTTQGNWVGVYGGDGYAVFNDIQSFPSWATVSSTFQGTYTWQGSGLAGVTRATQRASDPTDRIAACLYDPSAVSISVGVSDGQTHSVSLYLLDWDGGGSVTRREAVEVYDTASNTLIGRKEYPNVQNGVHSVWNISGNVTFKVTTINPNNNVVISAIFFQPAQTPAPLGTASFVKSDQGTQGNWKGTYGADGYQVITRPTATALPSYVTLNSATPADMIWAYGPTETSALQDLPPPYRAAAAWYAATSFPVEFMITDGQTHQLAIYALDWDNSSRAQTYEIRDAATNTLLDSRSISNFSQGLWTVWTISGDVTLTVTSNGAASAVISGIFFSPAVSTPPPAALIAELRLDEAAFAGTTGEAADSSGAGHAGSAVGPTLPTAGTASPAKPGAIGTCGYAQFTANGAISVPNLPVSTADNDITSVSFWMYWDGTDAVVPIGWYGYSLMFLGGAFGFSSDNYDTDVRGISSASLVNGWHHVAAVFINKDLASNQLYVDGVRVPMTQQLSYFSTYYMQVAPTLFIGGRGIDTGRRFSGNLDEMRVYNGAMTQAQVTAAMSAGHSCGGAQPAVLIGEYRLDELGWTGAAGEVGDSSGGGHPGYAIGTPLPASASNVPARPGNPGTCSYASLSGGAFTVPNLPASTTQGDATSVTFWMYWNGSAFVMPVSFDNGYNLFLDGVNFGFTSSFGDLYGTSASGLANGWHHVAAIFTNGAMTSNQLYIDGVSQTLTQRQGAPNIGTSQVGPTFRISGDIYDTNWRFGGNIDEVRVYNNALTPSDVSAAMNATHTCPIAPTAGAFNAFEHATAAGSVSGVIHTKVAGASFNVDIVALDAPHTSVASSFTGAVKVEILDASNNSGALDANACRSSWVPVAGGASTGVSLLSADAGRKAITLTEPEAWRDLRLRITTPPTGTPVAVACSSDDFAMRPYSFTMLTVTDGDSSTAGTARSLTNTGLTGGVVHKAGRPFTVRATAVNAVGAVTTNYTGTPKTNIATCSGAACNLVWTNVGQEYSPFTLSSPHTVRYGIGVFWTTLVLNGPVSCGNAAFGDPAIYYDKFCDVLNFGTLSLVPSAVGGVINGVGSYDEVGAFSLQLVDSTFAAVDIGDHSLPEELSIVSAAVDVGRFVPDHFDVQPLAAPVLKTFDGGSCGARSFTYLGQPFGYVAPAQATVLARNAAGATTVGYTGGLWKLTGSGLTQSFTPTPATPAIDVSGVTAPALTSNSDGTGLIVGTAGDKLRFVRPANAPIAPFNANLALSWSAQDASEAGVAGNGTIGTPSPLVFSSIAFDSGNQMRFGQLRMVPAYGSELIDLPVLIESQYWDGQRMATNAADQCTALPMNTVAMGNYQRNLAACKTALGTSALTLNSGRGYLKLKKPGQGNSGSVDLALQLAGTPTGQSCAAVAGSAAATAAAGLPWLQGRWGNAANYDQNPSTRASFGQYRTPLIYQREAY